MLRYLQDWNAQCFYIVNDGMRQCAMHAVGKRC
jgi:hypothetical protein